jgi:hypothetical protein
LHEGLATVDVTVTRESYCTMGRDDAKLLGTLDLRVPGLDAPDLAIGLGLRAANDKTCSVQLVAACRVFVCDNWAFAGSDGAVCLKRRHSAKLDVRAVVPRAIEQFLERAEGFRFDIERMQDYALSDGDAKGIIHDAFASGIMPLRLFPIVSRLYFDDDEQRSKFADRTHWSLNQAFTEAVKLLRPGPQATSGLRLGRMFGRLVGSARREPIGVVDGIEVWG